MMAVIGGHAVREETGGGRGIWGQGLTTLELGTGVVCQTILFYLLMATICLVSLSHFLDYGFSTFDLGFTFFWLCGWQ